MPPPRYPSDLSDEEWRILEPLLSSAEKRGRPPKWPLSHVADAVFSTCSEERLDEQCGPLTDRAETVRSLMGKT